MKVYCYVHRKKVCRKGGEKEKRKSFRTRDTKWVAARLEGKKRLESLLSPS